MKKVISINSPTEVIVAKLNKTVKCKVEIQDKMGLTDYYFGGEKIVQNEFVWDSAKHVNNFFRIKGEIIDKDNEHTEIHIKVVNRPSYYVIYGLAIWFLLIACLTSKIFWAIWGAVEYLNTRFSYSMPCEDVSCGYSDRNEQCIKERCPFYVGG